MAKITIEIPDDLLGVFSEQEFRAYLEKRHKDVRLVQLAKIIKAALDESSIDLDAELEQAKHTAWQKYKSQYFKDGLA